MKKRMAIVYMAHDGFTSLYTGVGTVARDFLLSFPDVEAQLKEFRPDVELSLYATTLKYEDGCFGFSEKIKNITLDMAAKYENIHLVELTNGSAAKESYGTMKNWEYACISAATFVHTLEPMYDEIIVITVDTPFVQVANEYTSTYKSDKVQFIWLPQSTVKIHRYGKSSDDNQQGNAYEQQRYEWEKAVIDLAKQNERVRIGCVGQFMREHLLADYDADIRTLVDMDNSLFLPRLSENKLEQDKIADILSKIGVPLDRPLLFSFGRAEPYKGLDLVLKNVDGIIREQNYFILIFASPYSMDDPYLLELNALADKHPEDIKIVYDLDFLTPHYIMQWQNTSILAILSRAEPFGLIPIESRYYHNPNLTLLVSNRDGFKYQVVDGQDGFMTELTDEEIQAKLHTIATLSKEQKAEIATNGYNKVCNEYNQVKVNVKLLRDYLFNKPSFSQSLVKVAEILNANDITWCLGASGALYVQGVPVKPKDLDIIVDRADFEKARDVLKPLEPGDNESFEFADQTFYKFPLQNTSYSAEVAGFDIASDPLVQLGWEGTKVSVHPLSFELEMYKLRPSKAHIAKLIKATMQEA